MNLILVGLQSGQKKDGTGTWNRISLRAVSGGTPKDFFVSDVVARKIRENNLDMHEVSVTLGLDDYLRPQIIDVAGGGGDVDAKEFSADDF